VPAGGHWSDPFLARRLTHLLLLLLLLIGALLLDGRMFDLIGVSDWSGEEGGGVVTFGFEAFFTAANLMASWMSNFAARAGEEAKVFDMNRSANITHAKKNGEIHEYMDMN
jgi:hypothetical protein